MPRPSVREVDVASLIGRVSVLETRVPVRVVGGPDLVVTLDPDQVEQMMINLIKNAAEATLETAGQSSNTRNEVEVSWIADDSWLSISVADSGPGLLNPDNAFVPFYTTKAEGTGIGLVLCRQIAEAHNGSIHLSNREGVQGCVAVVTIPLNRATNADF